MGSCWKAVRAKIWSVSSPVKIKRVFHIINSSADKWVNYLKTQSRDNGIIRMDDGCLKFAIDFISSSSFGMDIKIFDDQKPSMLKKIVTKNLRLDAARLVF